jgi:hypothetical protein
MTPYTYKLSRAFLGQEFLGAHVLLVPYCTALKDPKYSTDSTQRTTSAPPAIIRDLKSAPMLVMGRS